jgi:DNA-binding response OmpR family regulator
MPNVLVVGDHSGVRDVLELMLLDGVRVLWTTTPDETERPDVDVVVVGPGLGDLDAVRVHPTLREVPAVVLCDLTDPDALRSRNAWAVSTGQPSALDELTDRIQWLIARARHPSSHHLHRATPAA